MRAPAVLVLVMIVACGGAGSVQLDPAMPDDVEMLAADVVALVRQTLPARTACLEGLRIESDRDLTDRARYLPDDGTVVVRVPATAPRLTASLVHEIGHHLDAVCVDVETRAAFAAAQGTDPEAEWGSAGAGEDTLAELFAAAVVEVVTGDPDLPRQVGVTDAAVELVAGWGHGSSTP